MVFLEFLVAACWFIFRACLVVVLWVEIGFETPLCAIITIAATVGGLASMIIELNSLLDGYESQE